MTGEGNSSIRGGWGGAQKFGEEKPKKEGTAVGKEGEGIVQVPIKLLKKGQWEQPL